MDNRLLSPLHAVTTVCDGTGLADIEVRQIAQLGSAITRPWLLPTDIAPELTLSVWSTWLAPWWIAAATIAGIFFAAVLVYHRAKGSGIESAQRNQALAVAVILAVGTLLPTHHHVVLRRNTTLHTLPKRDAPAQTIKSVTLARIGASTQLPDEWLRVSASVPGASDGLQEGWVRPESVRYGTFCRPQ